MANWIDELPDGTNVWKLKVPSGVTIFTAVWDEEGIDADTEHGVYAFNFDGGTVSFFKEDGVTPTLKFEVGKKLYIKAVAKPGYSDPKSAADIIAYDEFGNKLTVEEDIMGYYIPAKALTEDTGSVYVSVDFENGEKTVTFEIKPDGKTAKLVMSDGRTAEFSGIRAFDLPVGMDVAIISTTDGYEDVVLTADAGTIDGNVYTVPNKAANVTITLKEAANPIKWTATGGSLAFKNGATYAVSAKAGETILIEATPNDGYNPLERTNLVVTKISDGSVVAVDTSTTPWKFTMPAGGVNVSATFESSDTIKVHFNALSSGLKAELSMSEGSTVLDDTAGGKTFYFAPGTVITVTSETQGYDSIAIVANKGTVSGNKFTVPSEGNVEVTITMKAAANPIKWSATGGSLDFTNIGTSTPNIVSAGVGDKIQINTKNDTGYEALKRENLKVTKISDGSLVEVKGSGTSTDPWTFEMPAGGVNVSAVFEQKHDAATITFTATNGAVSLTMSGVSGTAYLNKGDSKAWAFPVGTVVTVKPENANYDKVELTVKSGEGVVKDNTFKVTKNATVEITLSSSKNPITTNTSSGTISYYTDPNMQYPVSADNVEVSAPVYLKVAPVDGYGATDPEYPTAKNSKISAADLEAWKKIIKITKKADGSTVTLQARELKNANEAALGFFMPAGGVNVTVNYNPSVVTITVNITDNSTLGVTAVNAAVGNSSSYVLQSGNKITAKIGDVITFTPNKSGAAVSTITPSTGSAVSKNTYTVPGLAKTNLNLTLTLTITKSVSTSSYTWFLSEAESYEAPAESAENYEAPVESAENYEAPVESAENYEAPVDSIENYEVAVEAEEAAEFNGETQYSNTEAQGEQPEA